MTFLDHTGIVWSTARPEENPLFVAFVDACFGRPAGRSLRREFPVALHPNNHAHHYVGRIGGELVCAATAQVRDWITSAGSVRAACVGCFSTDPARRGQGLSSRLQQEMLETLTREGVQWAALWSDQPDLYAGRGFVPCGRERHGVLDSVQWPSLPVGVKVRGASVADAPILLALHRQHRWRVERTLDDLRAHLDPAVSQVLVAESAEAVEAYVAVGKGKDFPGYVADFAGRPDLVHALWGVAHRHGARAVLLPAGTDAYTAGAAAAMQSFEQNAAWVRRLGHGPDPARCQWAVGGFDSA